MFSRRSFLASVIAASSLRLVTDESWVAPPGRVIPTRSGQAEELTRTIQHGVYLVGDDIPGLDVESGDHLIVRDTHAALHRYLDHETLVILKDHGGLTWVKDLDPRQTVRRPGLRLVP